MFYLRADSDRACEFVTLEVRVYRTRACATVNALRRASKCLDRTVPELRIGADTALLRGTCCTMLEGLLPSEVRFGRSYGGCCKLFDKYCSARDFFPDGLVVNLARCTAQHTLADYGRWR